MSDVINLGDIGWDDEFQAAFDALPAKGCIPGRVAIRHKGMYTILTAQGEVYARIKGHLRYTAETFAELPVVGDWVAITCKAHEELWRIHEVLPRRTVLRRKVKGLQTVPQVLAANVTTVVVVMGLTEDFNLRRLERYLVLISESGAKPLIVLNKADLLDEEMIADSLREVRATAGNAEVAVMSAAQGLGIQAIESVLHRGETLVFVGSSGQGKSTLINAIMGEDYFPTGEVRESDGRGRHTTTTREMVLLPNGAVLIDSPGIREIQLWDADEGLHETFADIEELAAQCRFRDCTHSTELGCAVQAAIENEELSVERLENYRRLAHEAEYLRQREQEISEKKKAFREMRKKRS